MKIVANTDLDYAAVIDQTNTPVAIASLNEFAKILAEDNTSYDTGFMPQSGTGILRIRQSGSYTQICYQQEPTVSFVKWGYNEGDPDAKVYSLAHPYKIWIADFFEDLLVGVRHFFSPQPIEMEDDPLYHVTYPNTNCRGYSGTSVGWVCLYQTSNVALPNIHQKLFYAWERESGLHEPYNDANMSETDGPRFYASNGIDIYDNKKGWQKRSVDEGFEWMLDTSMLIPILIAESDTFATKHAKTGKPYTFGDASTGKYYPYYPSRLGEVKKKFYETGWGNSTADNLFNSKAFNKLSVADAPSVDRQVILDDLSLKAKPKVDFDKFTLDIADDFSALIISAKKECALCKTMGAFETELVPQFVVEHSEKMFLTDDQKVKLDGADYLPLAVDNEDQFFVCESCSPTYTYLAKTLFYDSINGQTSIEDAAFLTRSGLTRFLQLHKSDTYTENDDPTSKNPHISRCFVNVDGEFYPETMTIECLRTRVNFLHNNTIESMVENFHAVVDVPHSSNTFTKRFGLFPKSGPSVESKEKLSKFLEADYISNLEVGVAYKLSEHKGIFKDSLEQSQALIINDLSFSYSLTGQEDLIYDRMGFKFSRNMYLKDKGSQVEQVYSIEDLDREILPSDVILGESFQNYFEPEDAYFLITMDGGIQTLYVDTKTNIDQSNLCECDMTIQEKAETVELEGCQNKVCSSCVDASGNFKSIIDYNKDSNV